MVMRFQWHIRNSNILAVVAAPQLLKSYLCKDKKTSRQIKLMQFKRSLLIFFNLSRGAIYEGRSIQHSCKRLLVVRVLSYFLVRSIVN